MDGPESLVAKLAIIWNSDRGWVTGDPRGIALIAVLDSLAEQTGWDPFIEYDRNDEVIPLHETEREGGETIVSAVPLGAGWLDSCLGCPR